MKSDFIILAKNSEEIVKIAKQIQQQSLLPDFVVFGLMEKTTVSASINLRDALKELGQIFNHQMKFVITRILETECPYECIDICVKKCDGDYYSVFFADEELPDYFNFQLDTIVSNNKRVYMITPQEGLHGLVIYRKIHKHLGGSLSYDDHNQPILNKITNKLFHYAKKDALHEWQN